MIIILEGATRRRLAKTRHRARFARLSSAGAATRASSTPSRIATSSSRRARCLHADGDPCGGHDTHDRTNRHAAPARSLQHSPQGFSSSDRAVPNLARPAATMASPGWLPMQRSAGWPRDRYGARVSSARAMPVGTARASVTRDSERRSRTAVGLAAGRIHRDGTSRSTGHSWRSHATIACSSRRSMAALTPLRSARR
jgi:hypothetical protein